MKPLTDEDRKRLTLYLGECWHEVVWGKIIPWHDCQKKTLLTCSCGNEWCNLAHFEQNRTFATYEDLGKLKDKLVENGEWVHFRNYAHVIWKGDDALECPDNADADSWFTAWLFRPESCGLVAEYLEQKEGMVRLLFGTTRMVFLVGDYAIKVPSLAEYRLFLCGLLANLQEASFSKTQWDELCPVILSVPLGLMVVMKRCIPLTREQFFSLDYGKFVHKEDYQVPVENKLDSFGILDGRIVAVDYGS